MNGSHEHNPADALILKYLDGRVTPEDFEALSSRLRQDPVMMDRFVELSMLDRSIQNTLEQNQKVESIQNARLQNESIADSFGQLLVQLAAGSEHAQLIELDPDEPANPYRLKLVLVGSAVAALLALARGLAHWHATHAFCGVCGTATRAERAGHVRRCQNKARALRSRASPLTHTCPGRWRRRSQRVRKPYRA